MDFVGRAWRHVAIWKGQRSTGVVWGPTWHRDNWDLLTTTTVPE